MLCTASWKLLVLYLILIKAKISQGMFADMMKETAEASLVKAFVWEVMKQMNTQYGG